MRARFLNSLLKKTVCICRKHLGRLRLNLCEKLCDSSCYTLFMDHSMSVIDDDNELDRILENTNLHEYELIDLPLEQTW